MAQLDLELPAGRLEPREEAALAASPQTTEGDPVPDAPTLIALLKKHAGVVADVARETGRSRKQVYRWISAHGLDLETFRRSH